MDIIERLNFFLVSEKRKKKIKLKEKPKMGRIPTAPPGKWFKDKSKYNRKNKHKGKDQE